MGTPFVRLVYRVLLFVAFRGRSRASRARLFIPEEINTPFSKLANLTKCFLLNVDGSRRLRAGERASDVLFLRGRFHVRFRLAASISHQ
jgi:hypothetical protein